MLDEETMQKIMAVGLLLVMAGILVLYYKMGDIQLEMPDQSQCGEVIDIIYEQCSEEGNINLTTLDGKSKTLTYEHGICVIK